MSRDMFDNYDTNNGSRQRDLVLATNEYTFLQSKTNGAIKTYTGPIVLTLSAQESLVTFNPKTKQFDETSDFNKAKKLFTSAPEGWYVILKNPAPDNMHPETAKAVGSPELEIGKKIMIPGPCNFSLYPGQMTKVVRGHRLRTNQYLIARVYDAVEAAASISSATMIDAEGKEVKAKAEEYFAGQLLVIKGTDVSFYIPPTGIEVIPQTPYGDDYVREAVTLERLEYAILKDENGEKTYKHGPAVVFPKPTETFVKATKGGVIFRALELSPISGIYVKVIADYKDGNKEYKTGEELFITGNDQMIYYPRPEHALIQYDGKYMHHAIAIPEGEGRYILDRLTGEVKTVMGPAMYLPDPRTEVVVKRKLSAKECELIYPGNREVLQYNADLNEKAMEKRARNGQTDMTDVINNAYSTANQESTLNIFEVNSNISRGVSYTKPRTITLDTKYDGVVAVDVWTGYAINVVSKSGKREVICGPKTRLLDYDETLEAMYLSTGKPKTTDRLLSTAYLRTDNNKISDIINVQTKDYVNCKIKVSYTVDFLKEYKDKWFSVDNYVKYMCDKQRSLLKAEAKKYDIQEFYANASEIVTKIALNICDEVEEGTPKPIGRLFKENGMLVKDVEVLSVYVEDEIASMMDDYQKSAVEKSLELSNAEAQNAMIKKLAEYEKENAKLKHDAEIYAMDLRKAEKEHNLINEESLRAKERAAEAAAKQAERDLQKTIDEIHAAKLARDKKIDDAKIATEKELAEIDKARQTAYAETVAKIMESISEDLVAAMNAKANSEMTVEVAKSLAPYAIANGSESVSDVVNKLMRGTTLEETLKNIHDLDIQ